MLLIGGMLIFSITTFVIYILFYQEIYRLEEIAEKYPGYADVRLKLGKIFKHKKKYKKALKYLNDAIEIYPYYLEAYKEIYELYMEIDNKKEAKNILKKLKKKAKNVNDFHMLNFIKELENKNEIT